MTITKKSQAVFWFEDTIRSNPITHFGVWTPDGWKTHEKRFGRTRTVVEKFSGDGERTEFSGLPSGIPATVHDEEDPDTDRGIYPSEARVEYPAGRPRWAVSHTYLAYPNADQTLYSQEYTIDYDKGSLTTSFRRHVVLEEAVTDGNDGTTIRVQGRPISSVVVGNRAYSLCNSAVRGVWTSADKGGKNFYVKRQVRLCHSLNAVYIPVDASPVVQCYGVWKAEDSDLLAFDSSGECRDPKKLIANGIPLDCPKLGSVGYRSVLVPSRFYGTEVELMAAGAVRIEASWLPRLKESLNVPFEEHAVGFAKWGNWSHWEQILGVSGHYAVHWDFNGNGVVDEDDAKTLHSHIGREVRPNYYTAAYFGNDWLSTGLLLAPEMHVHVPVVCAWDQGAGYNAEEGLIRLFETPGPNYRVYVEYHYDVPADVGMDNIVVTSRISA